jgi:hypothetical protein
MQALAMMGQTRGNWPYPGREAFTVDGPDLKTVVPESIAAMSWWWLFLFMLHGNRWYCARYYYNSRQNSAG